MNQTPDLTNEFHPIPKPAKKGKSQPQRIQPGIKTKKWANAREMIKARFEVARITYCEIKFSSVCWHDLQGFAHEDKRVHLTEEDLFRVIGACNPCHDIIEKWPREKMKKFVHAVIAMREVEV